MSTPSDTPTTPQPEQQQKKQHRAKKTPPPNLVIPPKKPKLTKAERRALQEQQRADKAAGRGRYAAKTNKETAGQSPTQSSPVAPKKATDKPGTDFQGLSQAPAVVSSTSYLSDSPSLDFFSHLPSYRATTSIDPSVELHPAVVKLGRQYAQEAYGMHADESTRVRDMMACFQQLVRDYRPSPDIGDVRTHFTDKVLKPSFTYWTTQCRPHSIGMGNAFTFVKTAVASLPRDGLWDVHSHNQRQSDISEHAYVESSSPRRMGEDDRQPKELTQQLVLHESIAQYIGERLDYAQQAIAQHAMQKIANRGDVLLTFGYSEAIHKVLYRAYVRERKQFFCWVVDARPFLGQARKLLNLLSKWGVPCGYLPYSAATYRMSSVTKVLVGASALFSNGHVYGRVGTAPLCLLAHQQYRIPVLVCCETCHISNKVVPLESIAYNELGNPNSLEVVPKRTGVSQLKNDSRAQGPRCWNLLYDVTPAEYVSGIVTEVGLIPPTSIAVLLREMNPQDAVMTQGTAAEPTS